jgi:hypothetical protein
MLAQNKTFRVCVGISLQSTCDLRLGLMVDEDRRVCGNALAIVPLKAVKIRYKERY